MQSVLDRQNGGAPANLESIGGALLTAKGGNEYQVIPAGSTNLAIGAGKPNAYIEAIIILVDSVSTTTNSMTLHDGSNDIPLSPANGFGSQSTIRLELGLQATTSTGWSITTGAGVRAIVIGTFK